jgi:hypothetical protein
MSILVIVILIYHRHRPVGRNKLGTKVAVDPGLHKMQIVYSGPAGFLRSVQQSKIKFGGRGRKTIEF